MADNQDSAKPEPTAFRSFWPADRPRFLIEGPRPAFGPSEPSDAPVIDVDPVEATTDAKPSDSATSASADQSKFSAGPAAETTARSFTRHASAVPFAAGILMALVVGAVGGVGTTTLVMRTAQPAPTQVASADAINVLQASVAQLGGELASLKTGLTTSQKTASSQLNKLADRLDRTEKDHADPANRLAKLQDSIDRLEKRQLAAASAAPEVTGSIAPPKTEEPAPAKLDGWRFRDYFDGRALIEDRDGNLFRVGNGSNVPGLGRVQSIKRDANNRVTVLTAGGAISGPMPAVRRRPAMQPYPNW